MRGLAAAVAGLALLMEVPFVEAMPEPPAWRKTEKRPARVAQPDSKRVPGDPVAEMEAAYLRGEYAAVVAIGQRVPPGDRQDQSWYLMGLAQLQLQQPEEARDTFVRFLDARPDSARRVDAELGAADALWLSEEPARAVALYQAVLARLGPDHPAAPRARYQLGQAARQAGLWTTARQAFEEVVARSPQSFEAGLARAILQQSDFTFSVQIGAFGVRDNAVRLQRRLAQRGYSAMVDQALADGRVMHRVRIGRFSNREQASDTASRLRQDGFPARVVP